MSDLDPALVGYSDADAAVSGFSSSQGAPGVKPTAGAMLRDAREAAGMHIAALAALLKVPVNKLEALEQDRFDLLPDVVFARALASSMCRTLKLDVAPVLERLPQISAPKLNSQGGDLKTPFRSYGDSRRASLWTQVSRPTVLTGLAFLLGALVLIFLPVIKPFAVPGMANDEPLKFLPPAGVIADTGLADSVQPVVVTAPQTDQTVVLANAAAMGSLGTTKSNPSAELTDIVTFRAKGDSWVEVTDAKGTVVLRRTLAAGELVGASGVLPLAAVVGRADSTQVEVRGQAFDLSVLAKNNVARFEVK
jgi:cytoskeleton protein RodZ